jgi:hypothetical protein
MDGRVHICATVTFGETEHQRTRPVLRMRQASQVTVAAEDEDRSICLRTRWSGVGVLPGALLFQWLIVPFPPYRLHHVRLLCPRSREDAAIAPQTPQDDPARGARSDAPSPPTLIPRALEDFCYGPGAEARNSIGLVLVGGMAVGTVFTLFVVPSLYVLIAKDHAGDAVAADQSTQDTASLASDAL